MTNADLFFVPEIAYQAFGFKPLWK
jgi:hypothetical protein